VVRVFFSGLGWFIFGSGLALVPVRVETPLGAREVLTTCCWSWCGVGVNVLLVKVSN
jgi:hypothetical protein